MRRTVIVTLKEPRPGRVKTRLGREIGMGPAARWFRSLALMLLRRVRDPRWDLVLAVAPDREGLQSRVWPSDVARIPQGKSDLDTRIARAMRRSVSGPVCVVGTDIPGLARLRSRRRLRRLAIMMRCLGRHLIAAFGWSG